MSTGKRPGEADRKAAFKELIVRLEAWTIPDDAVDTVHDAARASLNEVKALTEYEDGKVSRLLTVIAFLSAVVGAVFTRFSVDYGWPSSISLQPTLSVILPLATYVAFFAYVIIVTWSVLVILKGIRPTFNTPATWKGPGNAGLPTSMLFYRGILDVTAPKWGEAFEQLTGAKATDLKKYYAKCYVAEAYLVAEKVADKLEVVSPGVDLLRWAMRVLLVFFLLYALSVIVVQPRTETPHPAPAAVTAAPQAQPFPSPKPPGQ